MKLAFWSVYSSYSSIILLLFTTKIYYCVVLSCVMECIDCSSTGAETFIIEYSAGETEELTLCETCRDRYEDGGLVTEIEPKRK